MDIFYIILIIYLFLGIIVAKRWIFDANKYGRIGKLGTFIFIVLFLWVLFVLLGRVWLIKRKFICIFQDRNNGKNIEFILKVSSMNELNCKCAIIEIRNNAEFLEYYSI